MILECLSCYYLRELYRTGSTIAFTIRSVDPIQSLDPTLGLLEAGAQGISIAVIIHSFDRILQDGNSEFYFCTKSS